MDSEVIEILHSHRLSTARRLFVLEQILRRAEERSPTDLVIRIRRVMDLEHQNLRRKILPDQPSPVPETVAKNSAEDSRHAHHEFVELSRHIISSFPATTAHYLLAPAVQQCSRLRDFAARSDGSSLQLDEPTEPRRRNALIRTNS